MLGAGMTGIAFGTDPFTEEEKEQICAVFKSCGGVELIEESQMEAVGCVSGCSPAFVYMFIEALADSGVKYGLPVKQPVKWQPRPFLEARKWYWKRGKHPGQLKDEVCSPGGTTIAGVSALEEFGFRNAVIKAADACYEKARK